MAGWLCAQMINPEISTKRFQLRNFARFNTARVKERLFNLWPTYRDGTPSGNETCSSLQGSQHLGSQARSCVLWFHGEPSTAPCKSHSIAVDETTDSSNEDIMMKPSVLLVFSKKRGWEGITVEQTYLWEFTIQFEITPFLPW